MKIDQLIAALLLALALTFGACESNGACPADHAVGTCSMNGLSCDYQEVSCTCAEGQWACSGGPADLAVPHLQHDL